MQLATCHLGKGLVTVMSSGDNPSPILCLKFPLPVRDIGKNLVCPHYNKTSRTYGLSESPPPDPLLRRPG